jgi:predicted DNA-binding transcriptional regulator AlpA
MFTLKEFCEFAKISRAQFYVLKAQGRGPKLFHIGKSVRVTKEAAQEWVKLNVELEAKISQPTAAGPRFPTFHRPSLTSRIVRFR